MSLFHPPRRRSVYVVSGALVAALASSVVPTAAATAAAPTEAKAAADARTPDGLGKKDRSLLADAKAKGEKTVTMLIAATEGDSSEVASRVQALGGTVEYREDGISYLRVEVPTGAAEKVATLPGVSAADLDEDLTLGDPRPGPEGQTAPLPQAPPTEKTPNVNPYMPTGDTKTAQFVQGNRTWDGRGVTVGIVDSGIDLGHPALTTTSTGERKIVDWATRTDPSFTGTVNNDNDPTWVLTSATVPSTWTVPAGGVEYRAGTFNERDPRLGGEVGNDVNRDGNPAGSSGVFGVLWDKATNTVWVDTDQDKDFTDEKAMLPYKERFDVGIFGKDDPATAVSEQMPFVVESSPANNSVNIGIVSGAHGSHVAGIAAGNDVFGGRADGAAPGAKLVSVRACLFVGGCTGHALLEGMIYAARDAKVDVINMSIGGLPALNDGNNARAELYDNLIDTYGVQMFISAGNSGAGQNTVGDPSVASKVVSVGSYISDKTWLSNYGSVAAAADGMHPFSSRGPREDGGFKPQVIAPGSAISTVPTWQNGQPVTGTYALPPGLGMFNGTSMASPQAAGTAAVLLSAAKANGLTVSPAQLRTALMSTARFIDGYGAYEQGAGLISANTAWQTLRKVPNPVSISASVPVNTVLSGFLRTPGVGTGIYDREGVSVGDTYTRTYTLKRTSGPATPVRYRLSWTGNDGTFSSADSVVLPLDTEVALPVTVKAASEGTHSAVLNFDDNASAGVEFQTLNTIVAAHDFTAAEGYSTSVSGTISRNTSKSYFFRVPANTPALTVSLAGPTGDAGTGQVRFLRFSPYGVGLEANSTPNCYTPPVPGGTCPGDALSRTVQNPMAGVWEVTVEARRTSDVLEAPFTLTASVLGATVSPDPTVVESATRGVPVSRSWTVTNTFGAFTGRLTGSALGSAKTARPSIADGASQQYQVVVPAGSTSLRATIGRTSDPAADLDLAVYRCTTSCVLAGQSADGDSEESVTIASPAAATYIVLVDGYAVPAGTTEYDYVDVFVNSSLGTVSVTDTDAPRPNGSSWTVPGTVTATGVPAAGRVLLGTVDVRTSAGVLVGQGQVVVKSVQ